MIDRRSIFSEATDEEAYEKAKTELKERLIAKYKTGKNSNWRDLDVYKNARDFCFYSIGIIDYNNAFDGQKDSPSDFSENLKERALLSRELAMIEDLLASEFDKQISDIKNELLETPNHNDKEKLEYYLDKYTREKEELISAEGSLTHSCSLPIRELEDNSVLPCLDRYIEEHDEPMPTTNARIGDSNVIIPSIIYHGTSKRQDEPYLSVDEVGGPIQNLDADGHPHQDFKTKDGMGYFTFRQDIANKYANGFSEPSNEKNLQFEPYVLQRDLSSTDLNNKIVCIRENGGGVPFIYEDDLYSLSKEGNVQYLVCPISKIFDIIDISHYDEFVDERNKRLEDKLKKYNLRLPENNEDYDSYMSYIDERIESLDPAARYFKKRNRSYWESYDYKWNRTTKTWDYRCK